MKFPEIALSSMESLEFNETTQRYQWDPLHKLRLSSIESPVIRLNSMKFPEITLSSMESPVISVTSSIESNSM